jgi:hypothetical protein
MKVHIALASEIRANPEAKREALEKIKSTVEMSDINLRRFERHGIISGELTSQDAMERVEQLDVVQSVSRDGTQSALV